MELVAVVSRKVLSIFLVIAVGYVFCKKKWVNQEFFDSSTQIVTRLLLPCYMISRLVDPSFLFWETPGAVRMAVTCSCIVLINLAIGFFVINPLLGIKERRRKPVLPAVYATTNVIFLGMALCEAVLGPEGAGYGLIILVGHDMVLWTVGMATYVKFGDRAEGQKIKLGPIPFVFVGSVVLKLVGFQIPEILYEPIRGLGDMVANLLYLFMGAVATRMNYRKFFKDKAVWVYLFCKLLIMPGLLAVILFKVCSFGLTTPMITCIVLTFSAFAVTSGPAVHKEFGLDYEFSNCLVQSSVVAAIFTIPVIAFLITLLGG